MKDMDMRETLKKVVGPLVGLTEMSWSRIVMNRTTQEWVGALDTARMDALEISGEYWKNRGSFKSYRSVSYPEYDLCGSPLPESFDFILAEQVFEHLLYPHRAAQNVHRMLRTGGFFLVTTPFLLRIHSFPTDCTRWTPQGLSYFLEEAGFSRDKMRVQAWGNRQCVRAIFKGARTYCSRIHSLANEPDFSVVVWALVQK